MGAVIIQKGCPLAFFSLKLRAPQTRYIVTELELLSTVECLKNFKGMLWVQCIKVYMGYKNPGRDTLGLSSDHVHQWKLY